MMHSERLGVMMHSENAFGENEGGDDEDVARDQEQGHANARRKGQVQ